MAPTSRQCSLVGIEIYIYCSSTPVRLAIHIHRHLHTNTQSMYNHLIRRNTLPNGRMVGRAQLVQGNLKVIVVYP